MDAKEHIYDGDKLYEVKVYNYKQTKAIISVTERKITDYEKP